DTPRLVRKALASALGHAFQQGLVRNEAPLAELVLDRWRDGYVDPRDDQAVRISVEDGDSGIRAVDDLPDGACADRRVEGHEVLRDFEADLAAGAPVANPTI